MCMCVKVCQSRLTLCNPMDYTGQTTGVGSCSLLQRIFTSQGSNPGLQHCRWILYQLSHKGSPRIKYIDFKSPGSNSSPLLGFLFTKEAAAAKSLQSCPTLCDPIGGSPPGSPVLGILQARTPKWVAISFSNA